MWKEFLSRVWGEQEGWAFLAYVQDANFHQKHYEYPRQLDLLVAEAERLNQWADVYFSTHLCHKPARKKKYALPVRALWIDLDYGDYSKIEPEPSIIWETSNGRYQGVWLLDSPAEPEEAEQVNKFLTYWNKGDKGKWPLTTVLRLPESVNYKYSPPVTGKLLKDSDTTYSLSNLMPEGTSIEVREEVDIPDIPEKLPTPAEVLTKYGRHLPGPAWGLLNDEPGPDEDWSERLWKLERLLLETGMKVEEAFVLARDAPCNKYRRDNRPDAHLWIELHKALSEQIGDETRAEGLPWVGIEYLLHHSERPEWLVKDIWMDKNVGWIAGVGKSYKSVLSLDLALSIASGTPFLGEYEVMKPGPVLMIQEEDPLWRVAHRVQVISEAKGITRTEIKNTGDALKIEVPGRIDVPLHVSVSGGFLFHDEEKLKAVETAIERYSPRIVFIDPLFMVTPGVDEFKAGEITPILNIMKRWRNDYDCSVSVVHHYSKSNSKASHERLYGSMALYAWSECNLFFDRPKGDSRVTITRDIKDAPDMQDIGIRIDDIDDAYEVSMAPTKLDETTTADWTDTDLAVARAILKHTKGKEHVTRKELILEPGIEHWTIDRAVKKLEAKGLVLVTTGGHGGVKRIRPDKLLPLAVNNYCDQSGKGEDVLDLIDD